MPWDKKTVAGKICVYKKTTGKILKCYDTPEEANKYLSALYANSPDAEKEHTYTLVTVDGDGNVEEIIKSDEPGLEIHIQSDGLGCRCND